MGRWQRILWTLALGVALVGCHDDPPPQTPESAAVDDTPIGTEPGNRLQPAPDRFAEGCSSDTDCVIESDPCGYAQSILASERDEYQEGFEGVAYDCPPVEYPTDPVAACSAGRCVGHVPGD